MIQSEQEYQAKKTIFKTNQIVWYLAGIANTLLAFRFLFKVLGANRVGIVNAVYSVTDPLALPFYGIFNTSAVAGSVFEWTTLVAIVFIILLAYAIVRLLEIVKPTNPTEVERNV